MLMFRFSTCIFVLTVLFPALVAAEDPCRFEYASKGVVDLTSVGHKDGTAAFPDEGPVTSNYRRPCSSLFSRAFLLHLVYSYNPCKPFSEGTECKDVAVCQGQLAAPRGHTILIIFDFSVERWQTEIPSGNSRKYQMDNGHGFQPCSDCSVLAWPENSDYAIDMYR